jgi:hypothetical protein
VDTRHLVADAVGCPKSAASVCRRHRRTAIAIAPEASAASDNRRDDVIGSRATSATNAKSTVPDAFLETGHHRLFVAGIDIDDTVRRKTDLGQGRREQVLPGDTPEDLALSSSGDTCREQGGRCAIDGGAAASCHFVQRP